MVKVPGAIGMTFTDCESDWPPTVTVTCAMPAMTSKGTCVVIWPGETANSGAGIPLIVTPAPPSENGRGTLDAVWLASARWVPKIARSEPGATVGVYDAALPKPPERITGLGVNTCGPKNWM